MTPTMDQEPQSEAISMADVLGVYREKLAEAQDQLILMQVRINNRDKRIQELESQLKE